MHFSVSDCRISFKLRNSANEILNCMGLCLNNFLLFVVRRNHNEIPTQVDVDEMS